MNFEINADSEKDVWGCIILCNKAKMNLKFYEFPSDFIRLKSIIENSKTVRKKHESRVNKIINWENTAKI